MLLGVLWKPTLRHRAAEAGTLLSAGCLVLLGWVRNAGANNFVFFFKTNHSGGGGGGAGGGAAAEEAKEEEEEEEEADIGGGMDMFGGEEGGDY